LINTVNHPLAKQVAWGLRPRRGLTVLQKPLNFTGRDKGKAFPLPPTEEAASALVKRSIVNWIKRNIL